MGSLLQRRGLKPGQSPEQFGMTHPEVVATIHKEYIQAGARVITTNTFGATSYKLPRDLGVFETNETMARIARQAAGGNALVAGSVGPTGRMVAPWAMFHSGNWSTSSRNRSRVCSAAGWI